MTDKVKYNVRMADFSKLLLTTVQWIILIVL